MDGSSEPKSTDAAQYLNYRKPLQADIATSDDGKMLLVGNIAMEFPPEPGHI